ncbi:hypothetical protein ABZS66_19350 [Dactylosporangium sp. NPDC005572]|uniref:hypothetical protein n=1 Tax=Dactylosporangium sp. NPDC005572 TaxID=3156889 RepID=UPI0033B742EA
MSRPRRRGAAALPDPALHTPERPTWRCAAGCGDWPCAPIRDHMEATMAPLDISMVMAGHYQRAAHELDLPPTEVHRRMFGWIRGPSPLDPPPLRTDLRRF